MTIDGTTYVLTAHGRRRYLERVGQAPDREILDRCVGDPRAVWKEGAGVLVLVTYLASPRLAAQPEVP